MKSAVVAVSTLVALALARPAGAQGAGPGPDGAALYKQNCAGCHGAAGVPAEAMTKMFKNLKPFADPEFFKGRPEDSTIAVMTRGVAPGMRSFKDKLSKEQMGAIAKYIRTLAKTS